MTTTTHPALSTVSVVPVDSPSNTWLTYTLSGVRCPGTIPRGGVRGFKRKTGWDIKKGKGTKGATLTLKDQPPVEGTITSQLNTRDDFDAWDAFVDAVLSTSVEDQTADGLAIEYPQFASIDLTTVVIQEFSGPEIQPSGLYHVTVEFLEWSPPPNASIVQTVAATSPDVPGATDVPPQEDPRITALQAQIGAMNQATGVTPPPITTGGATSWAPPGAGP